MKLKKVFILVGLFKIILSGTASAYRPFVTEDADVAGKGVFQTEMSWDYLKWRNGDIDQVFLLVSPIYGPTETLELSAEIPYLIHELRDGSQARGVGDINLVAKQIVVRETAKVPLLCLKGVVKLDTGDSERGLGSGDKDYALIAVASKSIDKFQIHGQLGYDWIGKCKDENLRDITIYGFAIDYALTEPFHVVGEVYGNKHPDRRMENMQNVLMGVTYKVSERLILDATYRRGLTESSLDWGAGVGLAAEFK